MDARSIHHARRRRVDVVMLLENHPYPEDTRVRNEAESLVAAGHRVVVLAPRWRGQRRTARVNGVQVRRYWLPLSSGGRLGYVAEYVIAHAQLFPLALRELLRGADVVHLHNPPDTLFPVALMARALGRRAVFDLHDLAPELFEEKFGSSRIVDLLRACQRLTLRCVDAALVTNEPQAQIARGAARKVAVVRNGPRRDALRRDAPGRTGVLTDPHLLFVGNIESQDGALMLPALLAALHRRHGLGDAHLTVAGGGACLDELSLRAEQEGVRHAVRLLGRVEHRVVGDLIASADICIEPAPCSALNHRTSMIKVVEYLAGSRPVVAFALEETRRTAGGAALYARCGDVDDFARLVAGLANDDQLRARLAGEGGARAPDLVWEASERVLLDLYEQL